MTLPAYIQPTVEDWLTQFHFSTHTKVRVCETDLFGHVNNTSYSPYFEQGRADYLEHFGFYDCGLMFVVGDIYCHFHREAYVREELIIKVRTSKFGTKSLTLESAILRKSTGELIASNWSTLILMDSITRKTIALSDFVKESIRELEKDESLV
ncbi:thioesterase family protein [Bacillus sp. REN10]|uniref:acyl-CoA thioesterase n=1 Tax=Bacillus sp. REN10 TaxID=2782541 RepID=UPI00193BA222|nr:thioesterase family protein [Bacillus sp. REN10]